MLLTMLSLPNEILVEIILCLDAGSDIKSTVMTSQKLAKLAAGRRVLAHINKHTNHLATLFKIYPDRLLKYHTELLKNKHVTAEIKKRIGETNREMVYVTDKPRRQVDIIGNVRFVTDLSDKSIAEIKEKLDDWIFMTDKSKLNHILLYSHYKLTDAIANDYIGKYAHLICENENVSVKDLIANRNLFDFRTFDKIVSTRRDVTFNIIKHNPQIKWDLRSVAVNANIAISELVSIGTKGWTLAEYAQNPNLTWRDVVSGGLTWNWKYIARYI